MNSLANKLFGLLDEQKSCVGENGSYLYTKDNVSTCKIKGSFVSAFNGIMENTTKVDTINYIETIINALEMNESKYEEYEMSTFYSYLFILLFLVRDIRNTGKGRRNEFYIIFEVLFTKYPTIMKELLEFVPEYGYWKDYNQLYKIFNNKNDEESVNLCKQIIDLYTEQIKKDIDTLNTWKSDKNTEKCELSLAVKWVPKEGRSLDKQTKIYNLISESLCNKMEYKTKNCVTIQQKKRFVRQSISPIQDAINTTEKLECTNKFDEIQFKFVPGRTMFKKKLAYLYADKNGNYRGSEEARLKCRQNLLEFIELVKGGKAKIHGKTMFIHELCEYIHSNSISSEEEDILNAQYNDHLEHFRKIMIDGNIKLNKGVVLADFSGSMTGDPMNAAMAIAILISDLCESPWNNRFISFESEPQWIQLTYPNTEIEYNKQQCYTSDCFDSTKAGQSLTFCEKVRVCASSPWGGSTNFMKAHELILNIADENNLTQEDMPEWFICASDMQFNHSQNTQTIDCEWPHTYGGIKSSVGDWDENHTILTDKYNAKGYTLPQMIYWNLRDTSQFVSKSERKGVQMLSGFSTMQLKSFLETLDIVDVTPWDTFLNAINNECFDDIKIKLKFIDSAHLEYYLIDIDNTNFKKKLIENFGDNLEYGIESLEKLLQNGELSEREFNNLKQELIESSVIVIE